MSLKISLVVTPFPLNFVCGNAVPMRSRPTTPLDMPPPSPNATILILKILYNSQTSVGGRQYTIILFISIIFLPAILIFILMTKRGGTMGARRGGGKRGHLPPPPLEIQKYGGPPRIT